jgi:signal transduction histidine kinase
MKRNLLIIILAGVVLVMVASLALHLHQQSKKEILAQFNEHQLDTAKQIAREIESHIRAYSIYVQMLAAIPSLQYLDRKRMPSDIQSHFEYVKQMHARTISVGDAKGKIVYSTLPGETGPTFQESEFFEWAKKEENRGKTLITPIIYTPSHFRLLVVTPIYQQRAIEAMGRGHAGKFVGFLSLTVDLAEVVSEHLSLISPKMKLHHVWLMEGNGRLLLQSEHPEMGLRDIYQRDETCNPCHISFDYVERMLKEREGTSEYQLRARPKRLAAFAPLEFENISWIVVVDTPYKQVTAFASRSSRDTLWLLGIVVAAILGGITLTCRDYRLKVRAQEEAKQLREKRALEEEVRQRAIELEAANKELEAFSYSVSHDLRNPLLVIEGFSRRLSEKYSNCLDPKGQSYLNMIRVQTRSMGRLIDDLLAFSRLGRQEISASDINMGELAKTVFEELKAIAPERKLELNINSIPLAQGDPAMMRQVFVNLLSNAIKFTGPRGTGVIDLGCLLQEKESIYYVKDNGVGFDMQFYEKLFCVFKRLHTPEEFEGTGVGLAMVQRIIERHGGRLWAEGEVDRGATFYFSLPVFPHPDRSAELTAKPSPTREKR